MGFCIQGTKALHLGKISLNWGFTMNSYEKTKKKIKRRKTLGFLKAVGRAKRDSGRSKVEEPLKITIDKKGSPQLLSLLQN